MEYLGIHFKKLTNNLKEHKVKLSEQSSEGFIKQRIQECTLFQELAEAGELDWVGHIDVPKAQWISSKRLIC
ncbi:MAG: hypothetical protein AAGF89_08820 [Bacteroidota bacterium]